MHEQSHTIAHSQGLTNGLSGMDYRVLTLSPPHVQNKYIHVVKDKSVINLKEAFSANKITIIIYKRVFRATVNTYVSLPIFRGLDARGGKNYEQAHTHTRDNHSNDNNNEKH